MNRNTVQTLNGVLLHFNLFLSKYPRSGENTRGRRVNTRESGENTRGRRVNTRERRENTP